MPAKDGFIVALAHARIHNYRSFIDPDTLTEIQLDKDGDPMRYGMLVREARLKETGRGWLGRLWKTISERAKTWTWPR